MFATSVRVSPTRRSLSQTIKRHNCRQITSAGDFGRNKAVADLPKPKLHFKGFIAWLASLFIHVLHLVNYRNRITNMANSIIAYSNRDQ